MPTFFFDCAFGGRCPVRDDVGLDLVDLAAARHHGMRLLPSMGAELPLKVGETRSWTVTVRDGSGPTIVARFIMAIINDQCGPEPERVLRIV